MSDENHTSEGSDPVQTSISVQIPDRQLDRVLSKFDRDKASGISLDQILKVAQLAAVIGASVWTVFEYIDFRRSSQILDIQQKKLLLRHEELTLEILRMERQIKGVEVKSVSQTPLEQAYALSIDLVEKGKQNIYSVKLRIKIKNVSKNMININRGELKVYYGETNLKNKTEYAAMLNSPFHKGPIKWHLSEEINYISIAKAAEAGQENGTEIGGLAYGRIFGNETYEAEYTFLLKTMPHERWFGYVISLHTEEDGKQPWLYEHADLIPVNASVNKNKVER